MKNIPQADQNVRMPKVAHGRDGLWRMKFVQEHEDYIECQFDDHGSVSTGSVYVAKPPNLRGHIAIRAVEGPDGELVVQEIEPPYNNGNAIFAVIPFGGTGATDDTGEQLIYLDTNNDARIWTVEKVCEAPA